MTENITKLDLREIPVSERHPSIFDAWEDLQPEGVMQLINDHDPKPLRYQFEGEYKDKFSWDYVKQGPTDWVVNITKLKLVEATGEELRKKVEEALDEVRPYLQADGGNVELVEIDETARVVRVQLTGACGGCLSAAMTLKAGVENTVRKYAPEIRSVEQV